MNAKALVLSLSLSSALFAAAAEDERIWIGEAGGDFNAAANWDPEGAPDYKHDVVFTNDASPVVTVDNMSVKNVRVTKGNVSITRSGGETFKLRGDTSTDVAVIEVASGASLSFTSATDAMGNGVPVACYNSKGDDLVVKGGGTVTFKGAVKSLWNTITFDNCTVLVGCGGDSVDSIDKLLTLTNSATMRYVSANPLVNGLRVDVSRDSVYDLGATVDTLGAFTGEGLVTNGTATVTLYKGPHKFSGRTGKLQLVVRIQGNYYVASEEEAGLIIGSADALADLTSLSFGYYWDYSDPAYKNGREVPYATLYPNANPKNGYLRFAPGVGKFNVATRGVVTWGDGYKLYLGDLADQPIELHMGMNSTTGNKKTVGPGSFYQTYGSWSVLADDLQHAGALGLEAYGAATFGGSNPDEDADFSSVSMLDVRGGDSRAKFSNHKPLDFAPPVVGDGTVWCVGNAADVIFRNFSMTNGTLAGMDSKNAYSNVTVAGGVSKGAKISTAYMADGCELRITGGTSDGMTVMPDKNVATNVVFAGGSHTNFTLAAKSSSSASGDYRVTGGEWWFSDGFYYSGRHHWTITGGFIDFVNGFNNSNGNPLEISLDVGGDAEVVLRRPAKANYPRGMGMDAHGNAKVTLTRNAVTPTSCEPLRVASDNLSHTIRVRENAEVKMEAMILPCGDSPNAVTGRIELAGGTLEMGDQISLGSARKVNSYGHFVMDGGLLRLSRSQWNASTSFDAFNGTYSKGFDCTYLGANATEVDVTFTKLSEGWTWNLPIETLPGVETDGGIVKTGCGFLGFSRPVRSNGPIVLRDGTIRVGVDDADVKAVAAPITNVGMCAFFNTSTATKSGPFHYDGVARLQMRDVSASDCAKLTFDALAPANGKSALVIYDAATGVSFDGSRVQVKLADGATVHSTVVGQNYKPKEYTGSDRTELVHLHYDPTLGFISRDYASGADAYVTEFTDGAWWHNACANKTCDADANVKGVQVTGREISGNLTTLTIADGKTLTVGDGTNGVVILNGSKSVAKIVGGALDFGSSRGVVLDNLTYTGSQYDEISSVIKGTAGLTVGGVSFDGVQSYFALSGANEYTGGTLVDNVNLKMANLKAFSSGEVEVRGGEANGGTVYFPLAGTVANDFVISGRGHCIGASRAADPHGALKIEANATLSGDVEVRGAATIRTATSFTSATISGAISGGELEVVGSGTLKFTGDNHSLTGGVEIVGGVLEADSAAALGAGTVTVGDDAILRFVNSAAQHVEVPIVGDGAIELVGEAGVTFADLSCFTGVIRRTGDGTFDLAGDDFAVDVLVDSGVVTNSGDAATLTVKNEIDAQFDGVVAGAVSLAKDGAGTQALTANQTYAGATIVSNGTLQLGLLSMPTNLTVDGASLRLDASAHDTVTLGDDGYVATWSDADGRGVTFAKDVNATNIAHRTKSADGIDSVWLPGCASERLNTTSSLTHKETFLVLRPETDAVPEGHQGTKMWGCVGIFGATSNDLGERFANYGTISDSGYTKDNPSIGYVNGAKTYSITHGATSVVCLDTMTAKTYSKWSVGNYMNNTSYPRPYYGDLCELIVFPRSLNDLDRSRVTDYLMLKWGVKEQTAWQKFADVLPTTTDLAVADGATLDLWGSDQTVKSLSGAGAIANSASGHRAKLVVTDDSEFDGAIGADVDLVIGAGVRFTFGPNATIDENAVITALDGATLDLSGHEFRVRQYRGYKFQVSNGSFVSQIRYCPGTYLIVR